MTKAGIEPATFRFAAQHSIVSHAYSLLCSHTILAPLFAFSNITLLPFFLHILHSNFLESNVTVCTI